jgi:hypothetical protein
MLKHDSSAFVFSSFGYHVCSAISIATIYLLLRLLLFVYNSQNQAMNIICVFIVNLVFCACFCLCVCVCVCACFGVRVRVCVRGGGDCMHHGKLRIEDSKDYHASHYFDIFSNNDAKVKKTHFTCSKLL